MKIVATPQQVCGEHALEFWTGLLSYTRNRSEPCVKQDEVCSCPTCTAASMAFLRAEAIAAAGPAPRERVYPMPMAS